jgi:hypothetical protein
MILPAQTTFRNMDGSVAVAGASPGCRRSGVLGAGQVSGAYQLCACCVQLDSWFSAGWRPGYFELSYGVHEEIALIGWFLYNAASAQVHQVFLQSLLLDHKGFRRPALPFD